MQCVVPFSSRESFVYVGSLLVKSCKNGPVLTGQLGVAPREFEQLQRVWAHSTLNDERKVKIDFACVVSKLLYCLHTASLNKAELRKLDSCHAKCLRKKLGIQHSFISRICNEDMMRRTKYSNLSSHLLFGLHRKPRQGPPKTELANRSSQSSRESGGYGTKFRCFLPLHPNVRRSKVYAFFWITITLSMPMCLSDAHRYE